ncbi:MAG: HAMP domain-containing sensor histidine kinase [Vicinamibacterales bacterium]
MLHDFICQNRGELIGRCRDKVAKRSFPPPTAAEIEHGVPVFLDQLVNALRPGFVSTPDINNTALRHGHELLTKGFTVSEVVHDYGDVCQSITELAVEMNASISTEDFRTLNRCLDDAIAVAVTEYGRERNKSTLDGEVARGTERLGFLAHELRNLLNTAILAFEVVKTGDVGVKGSTGNVLNRSLLAMRALIGRSLAEVRLTKDVQNKERFLVSEFIDDLVQSSRMEAQSRGITLAVMMIDTKASIEADRQVLGAVLTNLLQNAFKFTRAGTTVNLRVGASTERVLIEVEDECGGLIAGNPNELFRPFEQRSTDRSGLGLGLAFSRWGAEANNGRLYTRNLPGKGCIFTIDLPRVAAPAILVGR